MRNFSTQKIQTSLNIFILFFIVFALLMVKNPVLSFADEDLIYQPVPIALNTSTFVAVTTGTDPCYGFSVIMSDGSSWIMSLSAAGTTPITQPAVGLSWDHLVLPGKTIFYAKGTTSGAYLNIYPGKKRGY